MLSSRAGGACSSGPNSESPPLSSGIPEGWRIIKTPVLICSDGSVNQLSPLWIAIWLPRFKTHNATPDPLPSELLTKAHENIRARVFTGALFEENWKGPKFPG